MLVDDGDQRRLHQLQLVHGGVGESPRTAASPIVVQHEESVEDVGFVDHHDALIVAFKIWIVFEELRQQSSAASRMAGNDDHALRVLRWWRI